MHHPEPATSREPAPNGGIEVAVLDRQGVIEAVNGPWTDFCEANDGNPARCGVGIDYLEICRRAGDEPGAREVANAIRAALAGDAPTADRIHIACHAPDQDRWFDVLVSSRTGDAGDIIGATVMLTQVPERRADPLESDARRALAVLDACPDALLVTDADGVVESVNRTAERLFGADRARLIGRTTDSLLSGPLVEPGSASVHVLALRADGWKIPVEVSLRMQDVEGEPRLVAALRNITERLRSAEQDQLVQRCVDGASDAIVVFDENSLRILYANRGAVEMFGHRRSELVDTRALTDLATDLTIGQLADALGALRHAPDRHVRLSTQAMAADGSRFEVEIQLDWPAPSSPNAPRPVVAVVRDLREGGIRPS